MGPGGPRFDPADIGLPFPFFMLVFDDPITRTAAAEVWPTQGPLVAMLLVNDEYLCRPFSGSM